MRLPSGYRLDQSDPDVVLLQRADGTVAGLFSAWGATAGALEDAAWENLQGRAAAAPPHPPRERHASTTAPTLIGRGSRVPENRPSRRLGKWAQPVP